MTGNQRSPIINRDSFNMLNTNYEIDVDTYTL